jgi:cobalamin biosynthesis protein CobD/CbiB
VTAFERWAVWSTSVATLLTGTIYLWMKYLMASEDPLAVVNHPWQPYILKLHILVAPLLVFSIGVVALRHVWRHLKGKTGAGRRSGYITLVVVGPMIMSGYLIQAITHRGWLQAMAIAHIATGLIFGLGLLAHQFAAGGNEARAERAEARRVRRRHHRHRRAATHPATDRHSDES